MTLIKVAGGRCRSSSLAAWCPIGMAETSRNTNCCPVSLITSGKNQGHSAGGKPGAQREGSQPIERTECVRRVWPGAGFAVGRNRHSGAGHAPAPCITLPCSSQSHRFRVARWRRPGPVAASVSATISAIARSEWRVAERRGSPATASSTTWYPRRAQARRCCRHRRRWRGTLRPTADGAG